MQQRSFPLLRNAAALLVGVPVLLVEVPHLPAAQLPLESVACAYDTLAIPVWAPDRNKPVLPQEALQPPSWAEQILDQERAQKLWQEEQGNLDERDF